MNFSTSEFSLSLLAIVILYLFTSFFILYFISCLLLKITLPYERKRLLKIINPGVKYSRYVTGKQSAISLK